MCGKFPEEEVICVMSGKRYYEGLDVEASCRRVAELINESGLSDRELSSILGLSVQSVNKWRNGRNLPDVENMFLLCRITGKRLDSLLVPLPGNGRSPAAAH